MNHLLKIGRAKATLILTGFTLIFLILTYGSQALKSDRYLFSGKWDLEYLQQAFIGDLPEGAIDIRYQSLGNYALLNFRASPPEALEFAQRFCYGVLFEGYDPFNSVDNHDAGNGYLIQTNPQYFYYSHPINPAKAQLGNRCSDIQRGGLHQIVVNTEQSDLYEITLEVSATCANQNAPHPCDGISIAYRTQGSIQLDESYMVRSRYAEGDSWNITLEPNEHYYLILKSNDTQPIQNRGGVQVSIIPILTSGNEPYCEACWINTYHTFQEFSEIPFVSPSDGKLNIRLFWMNTHHVYEMSVARNPIER